MNTNKILLVDDNPDILVALKLLLKPYYCNISIADNPKRALKLLKEDTFGLAIFDMNFSIDSESGNEGFELLEKTKQYSPLTQVLFLTAYSTIDKAVKSVQSGAFDFIEKPWDNDKLLTSVRNAIEKFNLASDNQNLRTTLKEVNTNSSDFIGSSSIIQSIKCLIKKIAPTSASVLITGENGTGKEVVAKMLYEYSDRVNKPFITIDLNTVPESLFESEIFGCVKGSFTGAISDKVGKVELANGGTLFLDEIGNLNLNNQAKLLRLLEDKTFYKVGSEKISQIDTRFIFATNTNLKKMVNEGTFRQDLYYRINTLDIEIPPLRDRVTDLSELAEYFLDIFNHKYIKKIKEITPSAIEKLMGYSFPGNIRELKHLMERAVILSESDRLKDDDFILTKCEVINNRINLNTLNIETAERELVSEALKRSSNNITKASQLLGITRASLYRRMEKYGL